MHVVDETPEILKLSRKQFGATLIALQLILLLAALDQTIISTAMPLIVNDLGGFSRYAWVTTAYLFASTIAVPVFGRLSDIFGRKPLLLGGVILFSLSSVLCGAAGWLHVSDGMTELIFARVFQGIGCGIIVGLSFTVIADILAPADRGRYQGHFAAVFAVASILGPVLGGWVAEKLSWRWLFFVNVPIGLVASIVFQMAFPGVQRKLPALRIDIAGIVIFASMMLALLLGLSGLAEAAGKTWAIGLVILGVLLLLAFIAVELRAKDPLMPLPLFSGAIVSICSLSLFVTGIGMFGSVLLVPLLFQCAVGVSPSLSGALLTPLIVTVAGASVAGGMILSRTRQYKSIVLFSLLLMTLGTHLLAGTKLDTSLTRIVAHMLVCGIGMGMLLPIYPIVIQNAVPQEKVGTVTGFGQFFRSVGGTFGVAAFGSLMLVDYKHNLHMALSQRLPPEAWAIVNNPLNPAKVSAELNNVLGPQSQAVVQQMQQILVASIDHVFAIYTALLGITLIVSLWLVEKPLRQASESAFH